MATITVTWGIKPAGAAFDIKEFFHTDVSPKARFGHHVIRQLEGDAVCDDRVLPVGDIGERSGMAENRCPFQGLHQVGHDGVLHQDGHRPGHAQVFCGDSFSRFAGTNHDVSHAVAHICQVGGEGQDGHDLAGDGDIEAGLALIASLFRTLPDGDRAQQAVVGIHHPPEGDVSRVDIQPGEALTLFLRSARSDRSY